MAHFDRYDICEAYWQYAHDFNYGGYATGRKREEPFKANNGDILSRLSRIGFRIRAGTLTDNGREIYDALVERKWL